MILAHEFVKVIPDSLEERSLYISMDFATVAHKCCCGCGREVVTPLSPTDWTLIYNGDSISLSPSIGNWSSECRAHYWIENSTVRWAARWSEEEIEAGRALDRRAKDRYYTDAGKAPQGIGAARDSVDKGFWSWLSRFLSH